MTEMASGNDNWSDQGSYLTPDPRRHKGTSTLELEESGTKELERQLLYAKGDARQVRARTCMLARARALRLHALCIPDEGILREYLVYLPAFFSRAPHHRRPGMMRGRREGVTPHSITMSMSAVRNVVRILCKPRSPLR